MTSTYERYQGIIDEPTIQDLNLNNVSFKWAKKCDKPKLLKKAIKLLKADGDHYPELMKCVEERLMDLDPQFKRLVSAKKQVDPETYKKEMEDLLKFTEERDDIYTKIKDETSGDIFTGKSETLEKERTRKKAENEKNKGNEAMKSKDFQEAIDFYKKAIKIDPSYAAVHSNMAQAYINLKKFKEAIEACNQSLEIDPKFLKSIYRRSRAHKAMGNKLMAAKDLKLLVNLDPAQKGAKTELDGLLKSMDQFQKAQVDNAQPTMADKSEFKRLQVIEEDGSDDSSDESGEEGNGDDESKQGQKVNGNEIQETQDTINETTVADGESKKNENVTENIQEIVEETKQDDPKIIKKVKTIESLKNEVTPLIKRAMYEDAIQALATPLNMISDIDTSNVTSSFKEEIFKLKMSIVSNLSLCHMRVEQWTKVNTLCALIIKETEAHILQNPSYQTNTLERALQRQAISLESTDRYEKAYICYEQIKKINPSNIEAFKGANKCKKMVSADVLATSLEQHQRKQAQKKAKKTSDVRINKNKVGSSKKESNSMGDYFKQTCSTENMKETTQDSINKNEILRYEQLKNKGNTIFKSKKYDEAVKCYTSTINLINEKHPLIKESGSGYNQKLVAVYITLLSNRAMAWVFLKKYLRGIEDSNCVIQVDRKNPKAFYRRALCQEGLAAEMTKKIAEIKNQELKVDLLQKQVDYLENSVKDCNHILKFIQDKKATSALREKAFNQIAGVKKLLSQAQLLTSGTGNLEQNRGQQQQQQQQKATKFEVINEQESSNHQQDNTPATSSSNNNANNSQKMNQEKLGKSQKIEISESIIDKALQNLLDKSDIPTNASQFELEVSSFKDKYSLLWKYIEKFDNIQLETLYSKRKIEPKYFKLLVQAFKVGAEQTNQESKNIEKISNFLISIKKTKGSKLLVKFLGSKDKAQLSELITLIKNSGIDSEKMEQLENLYKQSIKKILFRIIRSEEEYQQSYNSIS